MPSDRKSIFTVIITPGSSAGEKSIAAPEVDFFAYNKARVDAFEMPPEEK